MNPCLCGSNGTYRMGTILYTPSDVEIKVHNVPHYHCDDCGEIWYDCEVSPSIFVIQAYKNGLNEIDLNDNWYITDDECQKIIDSDPVKLKEIDVSNDILLSKSERIANAAKILESRKNINKEI